MKKTFRDVVCAEVALLLKQERLRQGLSLNFVAERSGLSRTMVTYVEQEERNPTLETLLRVSEALKLDLGDVIAKAQSSARKKWTPGAGEFRK